MALQTFGWLMNMGASADTTHNVAKVQFGDGYKQLFTVGINNKFKNWQGQKTGDLTTVIKPIEDFLDAHAGVTPFLWTDPKGETHAYTCSSYNTSQRKGNFWQISLKFERYFLP